jgi:hypothetical protein
MSGKFSKFSVWNQETTSGFRQSVFVMYHSTKDWESANGILDKGFNQSSGSDQMLGTGIYVSATMRKCIGYGPITFKLLVYPGLVCTVDRQDHSLQKTWHSQYGSAWVPPMCGMVQSELQVSE